MLMLARPKSLSELEIHPSVPRTTAQRMMEALEGIESKPEKYDQGHAGSATHFDFENHEVRDGSSCCFFAHVVARFADEKTPPNIDQYDVYGEGKRLLQVPRELRKTFAQLYASPEQWATQHKSVSGHVTTACLRQAVERIIETGRI